MTVAAIIPRNDYVGVGSVNTYSYNFKVTSAAFIEVLTATDLGVETLLTQGVDYTVTGVGVPSGGSIILTVDLPVGHVLTILQKMPNEQNTSIRDQSAYYASVHENTFDFMTRLIQQLAEQSSRSLVFKKTVQGPYIQILPPEPDSVLLSNPTGDELLWTDKEYFRGPQGIQGLQGNAGEASRWYVQVGMPDNMVGVDNDMSLDSANGDVFRKTAGAWMLDANIQGPTGAVGPTGFGTLYATTLQPSGTTETLDFDNGEVQVLNLSLAAGDVTVDFLNPGPAVRRLTVVVVQGNTARNVIWPVGVIWPHGQAPLLSQVNGATDKIEVLWDGSANYYGNEVGVLTIGSNLERSTANRIIYANGTSKLGELGAGIAGQVLTSGGATIPTWEDAATTVTVADTNSVDMDLTLDVIKADLKLSAAGTTAGNIKAVNSIETDGLRTLVPIMVGDAGSGGTAGVVPVSIAGDASAGKYLKADGTWSVPPGGGGGPGYIASVSNTDSITLAVVADDLTATLKLSAGVADAGKINAVKNIETDGLRIQVPILVGDAGSGGTAGVVPAPGSGDAAAGKFLKADGTWDVAGAALPLTTQGDLVVYDSMSGVVRLPVGTDTYVLTADSSDSAGVRWEPAASGGAVFPGTTKGDIYVYDGTDTISLGVGTDGQVLSADSAEATGLKWSAAGATGANTALSNLTTTAINTSLIPDTPVTYAIGNNTKRWAQVWTGSLDALSIEATNIKTNSITSANADITINGKILSSVATPVAAGDAATKGYVDGLYSNSVFTGTSIVASAAMVQKFRYTGGSAQTLATFTITAIPDGGTVTVTGTSNTNTITIPAGLTNIQMNGNWVGNEYSVITFVKDDTQLIEVSRNGI